MGQSRQDAKTKRQKNKVKDWWSVKGDEDIFGQTLSQKTLKARQVGLVLDCQHITDSPMVLPKKCISQELRDGALQAD